MQTKSRASVGVGDAPKSDRSTDGTKSRQSSSESSARVMPASDTTHGTSHSPTVYAPRTRAHTRPATPDSPMPTSAIKRLIDWSTRTFRRNRTSVEDDALVSALQAGDTRSLGELYERHWAMLVRFLDRVGCTESEDVVQQLFLQLPKKLQGYAPRGESLDKWLRRAAFNMYRTHRRGVARQRLDDVSMDGMADGASSVSAKITRTDLVEHLLKFLSADDREMLVMDEEGFSTKDIAEAHGMKPGAVRTRLSRARARLRAKEAEVRLLTGME